MADAIRFVSAHWVLHMKANRHESARAWVQAWARRWGFVATKTSSRTSQVRQFPLQLLALEDRLTPTVDLTFNLLAGWTPITPTNGQHDFVNDQQTGSGSLPQDVVGNNNHRAAYLKYDTGTNSGSTSDDYVAFRIRVNGTSDSTNISDGFTAMALSISLLAPTSLMLPTVVALVSTTQTVPLATPAPVPPELLVPLRLFTHPQRRVTAICGGSKLLAI